MHKYNIAVILTCFNRKTKTIACLHGLYSAQKSYSDADISLSVYLTDDGCTDGTSQAVRDIFKGKDITIMQGDGNLYWAGGMRFAWKEALKKKDKWDFYLLLNDDTTPMDNMFHELIDAHNYSLQTFGKVGVYSGVTCDIENPEIITYGGTVWANRFLGTENRVSPQGKPAEVDKTNANILLISKDVVSAIGIFYEGFIHGAADYDYSIHAKKAGFTVLITSHVCGKCERDHRNEKEELSKILSMTPSERKKYCSNPVHSSKDTLTSQRRNTPFTYPRVWLSFWLKENCPYILYWLSRLR